MATHKIKSSYKCVPSSVCPGLVLRGPLQPECLVVSLQNEENNILNEENNI